MVNSRAKGASGERAAAKLWREIGYADAKRGFQFRDGSENADVVNTGPWWVEVKTVQKMHPKGWLDAYDQALEASRDAFSKQYCELKTPLVMVKENRRPWVVFAHIEDLVQLAFITSCDELYEPDNSFVKISWRYFADKHKEEISLA